MMMSVERFERWLRGLDPQLQNPYVIQPRVEGLVDGLTTAQTATALAAQTTATAVTLAQQAAANLSFKANIASPTLTGTPQCPIAPPSVSDFQIANTAWVQTELQANIPPLAQVYRTVLQASGTIPSALAPNTFVIGSGHNVVVDGADSTLPPQTFSLQAADYPTVQGVTPKLRLRVQLFTNGTDTNSKFFFRLYEVASVAGGVNNNSLTLGAFIPDSEAGIGGPGVSSINDLTSVDFELPADGLYVLGVETIAMTADSQVVFSAQLLVHN